MDARFPFRGGLDMPGRAEGAEAPRLPTVRLRLDLSDDHGVFDFKKELKRLGLKRASKGAVARTPKKKGVENDDASREKGDSGAASHTDESDVGGGLFGRDFLESLKKRHANKDSDASGSDSEGGNGRGLVKPPKKKKRRGGDLDWYDVDDPFIDDEGAYDERLASKGKPKEKGFFVYRGMVELDDADSKQAHAGGAGAQSDDDFASARGPRAQPLGGEEKKKKKRPSGTRRKDKGVKDAVAGAGVRKRPQGDAKKRRPKQPKQAAGAGGDAGTANGNGSAPVANGGGVQEGAPKKRRKRREGDKDGAPAKRRKVPREGGVAEGAKASLAVDLASDSPAVPAVTSQRPFADGESGPAAAGRALGGGEESILADTLAGVGGGKVVELPPAVEQALLVLDLVVKESGGRAQSQDVQTALRDTVLAWFRGLERKEHKQEFYVRVANIMGQKPPSIRNRVKTILNRDKAAKIGARLKEELGVLRGAVLGGAFSEDTSAWPREVVASLKAIVAMQTEKAQLEKQPGAGGGGESGTFEDAVLFFVEKTVLPVFPDDSVTVAAILSASGSNIRARPPQLKDATLADVASVPVSQTEAPAKTGPPALVRQTSDVTSCTHRWGKDANNNRCCSKCGAVPASVAQAQQLTTQATAQAVPAATHSDPAQASAVPLPSPAIPLGSHAFAPRLLDAEGN